MSLFIEMTGFLLASAPGLFRIRVKSDLPLPVDDSATSAMLAEAIESLSTHIESLIKNQDYLINAQELPILKKELD